MKELFEKCRDFIEKISSNHERMAEIDKKITFFETPEELRWENLPGWVEYIAMDANGDWFGYEKKPYISDYNEEWLHSVGVFQYIDAPCSYKPWVETLVKRNK